MSKAFLLLCLALLSAIAFALPSAPTGLLAQQGNNSIKVSWNAISGASSYNVYRGTTPGAESGTAVKNTVTPSFLDNGPINGSTYYYKVQTVFASSVSGLSAEISAHPGTAQLAAPLLTAQPAAASVKLFWNPTGGTMYAVYRYDSVLGWIQLTKVPTTGVVDSGRTNGVSYLYRVVAENANGAGIFSSDTPACAGDSPVSAPTGIYTSSFNDRIFLSWNPPPGSLKYVIYRSSGPGGEGMTPYVITTTPYLNDYGNSGNSFYYQVAAINGSGLGLKSIEATGTQDVTPLAAPQFAGHASGSGIQLNWVFVSGASAYNIFRSSGNSSNYYLYKSVSGSTAAYLDTGVVPGSTYYYKLAGANFAGTGLPFEIHVKCGALLPAGSTAIAAANKGTKITVTWNPVVGVQYYNIYRGTVANGEKLIAYSNSGNVFNDSNVAQGTRYFYRVKSLVGQTEGGMSPEAGATMGGLALASPILDVKVVSFKITLHVGPVLNATSFNIYRVPTNGTATLIQQGFGIPAGSVYGLYTDTTAVPNTTYRYYVNGVCSDGEGPASNTVSATAGNATLPAPKNLRAYAGTTTINLYCATVDSATNYAIYRSTSSAAPPGVPYAFATTPYFTDPGASPGVVYYYWMAAIDLDGESGYSPSASATAGVSALPPPMLTLHQTATGLFVRWGVVPEATSYNVFRADIYNYNFQMIAQGVTGSYFTDSTTTLGVPYYYMIQAVDLNGSGSNSNTVSGVAGSTALAAPTNTSATSDNYNNTIDHVLFSPVFGAATYDVYRGITAGGEDLVPIAVGLTSLSFQDSGLTTGVRYYYKITAVDLHGQSGLSVETSVKPGSVQQIAPVASIAVVGSGLKLSWTAVAGATSYNIYRTVIGELPGANPYYKQLVVGLSYTDAAVTPGAVYSYRITAVSADGESHLSNVVTGHT